MSKLVNAHCNYLEKKQTTHPAGPDWLFEAEVLESHITVICSRDCELCGWGFLCHHKEWQLCVKSPKCNIIFIILYYIILYYIIITLYYIYYTFYLLYSLSQKWHAVPHPRTNEEKANVAAPAKKLIQKPNSNLTSK